jgi:transcriptional regulator with XRE-family HTH domain
MGYNQLPGTAKGWRASDMSAEAFGPRLRELREAAGLSQAQLAERAGMHRFGVAKIERGERVPGWDTVLALGKALGVPCTAFDVDEGTQGPAATPRGPGRPQKAAGEAPAPRRITRRKKT